jgi:hypothetical protein
MNKKRIAKEWLFFLGALGFGFSILPTILLLILNPKPQLKDLANFYSALFNRSEAFHAWLFALSPYFLLQLIRSIVWAIKAIRSSQFNHSLRPAPTSGRPDQVRIG